MLEKVKRYLIIAIGTILIVFAYVFITVPYGVITGGTSSLSMSLAKFVPLSVSALVTMLTVAIAIACYFALGTEIFKGSLFCCVLFIALFDLVALIPWRPELPVYVYLPLSGVVAGFGLYLCLRENASTVGTDTLGMIVHKYIPRISVANAMAAISILIMLLGLATHGLYALIQGVIFTLIRTIVLNALIKRRAHTHSAPHPVGA